MKEFLKERRATTLRINEESEDKNGLKTDLKEIVDHINQNEIRNLNIKVGLIDAAILMAADGYGKGTITGENMNQEEVVINTEDSQKNFLFDKDPLPEILARKAKSEFLDISNERDMRH